jgi:iron-sulfur cluster assembly accessory protein
MTYGMTYADSATAFDSVLEMDDLKVFVDSVALSYLSGVEIDYKTEGLNSSFVFKNVFASTGGSGACGGCGGAGGGGGGCA